MRVSAMQHAELMKLRSDFEELVFNQSRSIDPDDEYYWDSLAAGWALGRGASKEVANLFSSVWHPYCAPEMVVE